jgi:hypothetical protein
VVGRQLLSHACEAWRLERRQTGHQLALLAVYAEPARVLRAVLSENERSATLDAQVARYVAAGYRVVARTPFTAQLVKPKVFSFAWALVWFLLLAVGFVVYLMYYLSKQDSTVYLTVDLDGTIRTQMSGERPRFVAAMADEDPNRLVCPTCGRANHPLRRTCKTCQTPLAPRPPSAAPPGTA